MKDIYKKTCFCLINCFFALLLLPSGLLGQENLELWEIQGSGNESPYRNAFAKSSNNIVTAVSNGFFVIQTPDERSDNDITTSDGLLVFEADFDFDIGDMVNVEGWITESVDGATILLAEDNPSIKISSGNPLPSFTLIDENYPVDKIQTVPAWEWVESMLLDLSGFKTSSPSYDGFCYVAPTTIGRPFREAGIAYPGINELPVWDGNPEALLFNSQGLGLSSNTQLGAEMQLSGLGFVSGEDQDYVLIPITYNVTGDYKQQAVRPKDNMEASIGNINALFFEHTGFAYDVRLEKFTRYVLESMQAPDIIAFQEVGDVIVLQDLAASIAASDPTQVYSAFLRQGGGSIHTGYLVKNTVSNIEIEQLGENESLSIGGRKHDRPPLLLTAELNTDPPTPLAVINLHVRSLNGIEGSDQFFVRTKRHEQAVSIAKMVKALQLQYDNIFVVGDFNAFEFSDGYVDVVNQISGEPSLGGQFEVEEVLNTPLVNHSTTVDPSEQYSYVFRGNAQILDHCLSTTNMTGMEVDELQYIRGNADTPETLEYNDPILRVSDHDGFVVFLDLETELVTQPIVDPTNPIETMISHSNPIKDGNLITFNLAQKENLTLQLISIDGKLLFETNLGAIQTEQVPLNIPDNLVDGIYILKIQGNTTDYKVKVFVRA